MLQTVDFAQIAHAMVLARWGILKSDVVRWNQKQGLPIVIPWKQLNRRKNRSGIAVIELAVIIPVFMLILLGTIEACAMIFLQQSLEIASYEAARVTIVPKTGTQDVADAVDTILVPRRVHGYNVSVTPVDCQNAPYGTFIRVDVSASCQANSLFPTMFYGSQSLTGTVSMMKEF
jgi:Flp pilus assembly protein TadG